MKILIDLGDYDDFDGTVTIEQALSDAQDLISTYPDLAVQCSKLIED